VIESQVKKKDREERRRRKALGSMKEISEIRKAQRTWATEKSSKQFQAHPWLPGRQRVS
jgi:hypothetical protein